MEKLIITKGEVAIATESFGNKANPAILLIAGATVSMLYWDSDFCNRLAARGFFVIRYDHRDVGRSTFYPAGTTPYDIVDMTEDAITVLDGYNRESAHFVGMSLGGLIAQIATIKSPERVQTLTLFATGPWGDSDPAIPAMDQRIVDFQADAAGIDWTNENEVVNYITRGAALMSGSKPYDKIKGEALVRDEFRRAKNYLSMFNHAAIAGGESYYNRLHEIKHPTLIIHGSEDHIWDFRHAGVLVEKIEDAHLLKLEGTGHELRSDDWEEIIHAITHHIDEDQHPGPFLRQPSIIPSKKVG